MDSNNWFDKAHELMAAKRFDVALEMLAEIRDACLCHSNYWWLLAVCHGEKEDSWAAISALESATTYCRLNIPSQVLLGKLYIDEGFAEAAQAIFEHLATAGISLEEHLAEVIRQLGRLQQYDLAAVLCEQATEETPKDWQAWYALAYYRGRAGEPGEQIAEALERALELEPSQLSARVSLVKTLAALGNDQATQDEAKKISIEQICRICCGKCIRQLAQIYQGAGDRLRWQACIQRYADLRRRKNNHEE